MKLLKSPIVLCLILFSSYYTYPQNCINNTLSSSSLTLIPDGSITFTYKGSMVNVTVSKDGAGPDLYPYKDYNEHHMEGIWIGKNNTWADNTTITLSFSKPVTSISLDLWAINNDESGEEQIKDFRVYDSTSTNITSDAELNWLTGSQCKIKASKSNATIFDASTRTIKAKSGNCCEAASGTMKITSSIPISKISFRQEEMNYMFSTANGVVLGNINICVFVPPVIIAEKPIEKSVEPRSGSFSKTTVTTKTSTKLQIQKSALIQEKDITNPVLNNVHFEIGTSRLLESSYADLDKLVQLMKDRPAIKIELHGHTDNVGKQEINLKLSEDRVVVVKQYLISKGIAGSRIQGKGFGGLKPIAQGDSEESRLKNRRVEFVILNE